MTSLLSRKFIITAMTLLASTWMLYERLLTSADYKAVVIGTVGLYIAGNVAQKATAKDASQS